MKLRIVRPREIGMLSEHAGKVYEVAKVGEKEYRLAGLEHYRIRVDLVGEGKAAEIVQEFTYGWPAVA